MSQIADRLPRQKRPQDLDGIQALSGITAAPMTVSMNVNNIVCLPLASESRKLIWVPSQQIEVQLDREAELDKAFDRFPYLTNKQTAVLARRCSLHPDQVKVWFMAQRLRYGISWDYEDILAVYCKLKSGSQGAAERNEELKRRVEEKMKEDKGKKKKQKETVWENKEQEEISKQREKIEKYMRADEQLEREIKQPMEKDKNPGVKEDKTRTHNKRKRIRQIDEMGKKRMRQCNVDVTEGAKTPEIKSEIGVKEGQKCPKTEGAIQERNGEMAEERAISIQEWHDHKNLTVPDVPLGVKNPVTEADNAFVVAGDQDTFAGQLKDEGSAAHPSRTQNNLKTNAQLAMMKMAFLNCQYPDSELYSQLAVMIGIPRNGLVQWFSDMRYHIKRSKPRWMNQEQHRLALDNIRYQQCLKMLTKA